MESLLVIDKIPGPSSFDVVRDVKRLVSGQKVGHAGSLDPFASGVLVLLVGRATKLSQALLNADKRYEARIKLGEATDTMDRTGKVIESAPVPDITSTDFDRILKSFEGTWNQTPPMYSAKKLRGVRLYELARQNINVPRAPIPVQLYHVATTRFELPYIDISVHCSKGTYVRSLADEIGRRLGTVAHLAELRRVSCGSFTIGESISVESFSKQVDRSLQQGYRNFVKLLRAEQVFPPAPASIPRLPM